MESFSSLNTSEKVEENSFLSENSLPFDIYFDTSFEQLSISSKKCEENLVMNVANKLMEQKIDFGSTYEQVKRNIT